MIVEARRADLILPPAEPQLGGLPGALPQLVQDGHGRGLHGGAHEALPQPGVLALGPAREPVLHHRQGQPVGRETDRPVRQDSSVADAADWSTASRTAAARSGVRLLPAGSGEVMGTSPGPGAGTGRSTTRPSAS